jgi:hypothetical protein
MPKYHHIAADRLDGWPRRHDEAGEFPAGERLAAFRHACGTECFGDGLSTE